MIQSLLRCICLLCLFSCAASATDETPYTKIAGNGIWLKFLGSYYKANGTSLNLCGWNGTINGVWYFIMQDYPNHLADNNGTFYQAYMQSNTYPDVMTFYNGGSPVLSLNTLNNTTTAPVHPPFKFIKISNATDNDRDGDGIPDPDDPDPDDPDKDGDGTPDGDDCNPDDPSNTMTKPNCYRCDDGSAVASSADCPGGEGGDDDDDDDDDEEKSDWLKWGKDKKFSATAFALQFLDKLTKESLPDENKIVLEIPCNTINLGGGSYFNFGGWKIYFEKEVAPYVTVDDNPEFMFCLTGDHPADGMAFWKKCRNMLYQAWKIVFFLYFAVATYHRYCEL